MDGLKKFLNNTYDKVLTSMAVISSGLILLLMILIVVQVFCRYFSKPILFTSELATYILLILGLPSAAYLLRKDQHAVIDSFYYLLNPKKRSVLNLAKCILGGIACFVTTWFGAIVTYQQYIRGVRIPDTLQTPTYLLLVLIPFGTFLITIEFVRKAIQAYKELKGLNFH